MSEQVVKKKAHVKDVGCSAIPITEYYQHTAKKRADVEGVANFLNVPVSWVYDRSRRNAIPLVRVGKYVRFDLDEIDQWAKAGCPAKWEAASNENR